MPNSKFPYYIPPDEITGKEQDPLVYLYFRMLEQQHQIDDLLLKLRLLEQKTGPVFTNARKAEGPALGSTPKPVVVPIMDGVTIDFDRPLAPARNPDDYLSHPTIAKSATVEVVQEKPVESPLIINEQWTSTLDELNNGTQHLFLTGEAGTGKSTLANKWLSETYRSVAVTAPTGVAALRVSGETLHRFFHFPTHALDEEDIPSLRERDIQKIKYLDTLVVDEISMVRADLMDAIERTLRKYGPEPDRAFGGVRIVMIGDPFQLPPVVADKDKGKPLEAFLEAHYGTTLPFFFHANCWRDKPPKIIELTTIFRQSDPTFVAALNAIRRGTLTPEHLATINARVDPLFKPSGDEMVIKLVTTNNKAQEANQIMIQQLPGDVEEFIADLRGDFGNDYPTELNLGLKPGAAVMFIRNDNKDHLWVNGTLAKVVKTEPFLIVAVNGAECIITPEKWESVSYEYDAKAKKLKKTVKGTFHQIPLKVAAAITIHKSQGITLKHVIVDLGWGTFAPGQAYVSLSRAETLGGMVLTRALKQEDLLVSKEVQRFLAGEPIARPQLV